MPASFVSGVKKVLADAEPRFLVLTGDEPELRNKLVGHISSRNTTEFVLFRAPHDISFDAFLLPVLARKTCTLYISERDGRKITDWDWLPKWFKQAKSNRIVVEANPNLAKFLERKANTRGLVIDCSAPTGPSNRHACVEILRGWYGHTNTQLNLLLTRNNWQISPCIQLLDKLKLMRLPLSSETADYYGVVFNPVESFVKHMTENQPYNAMTLIPRLSDDGKVAAFEQLSQWLDKMVRVKLGSTPMKTLYDLSREVGLPKAEVELLQKQSKKFEFKRINKLSLALAATSKDLAKGYRDGVLEVLVTSW